MMILLNGAWEPELSQRFIDATKDGSAKLKNASGQLKYNYFLFFSYW